MGQRPLYIFQYEVLTGSRALDDPLALGARPSWFDSSLPDMKGARMDDEKVMCQNCGEREGTNDWVGEGGMLAWSHGWSQKWCDLCCVREQLAHAKKLAERIPELEEKLERLENEDSSGD